VQELSEWASSARFPDKPWLILGKGPTFSKRDDFDLSAYNLISLNHAVLEQAVDVAHVVDLDVIEDCGETLLRNSRFVVIPRHPHVGQYAAVARLEDFIPHVPILRELDEQGRLIWYNAETGRPEGGAPILALRHFSSEAALGIVAHLGATVVRSLGVDGGQTYSNAFASLSEKTLLRNDQPSFNAQFVELDRIARHHDVDFKPLVPSLRIFVGADPKQRVAAEVLAHTLHEHASVPLRVDFLDQPLAQLPRRRSSRPRTPFSFNRFLIPSLMGFEGTALYLDSDMLVFSDVAELFSIPFGSKAVLCSNQPEPPAQWRGHPDFKPGRQFSVMLIDCARARWTIEEVIAGLDDGAFTYDELMFELALVPPDEIGESIPPSWNHLEHFEEGATKLLHYTVVPTQPWRNQTNPLRHVWLAAFRRAHAAGGINRPELWRAAQNGWIDRELFDIVKSAGSPITTRALSAAEIELRALRAHIRDLDSSDRSNGIVRAVRRSRGFVQRLTLLLRRSLVRGWANRRSGWS
jgi:hypothetical protein